MERCGCRTNCVLCGIILLSSMCCGMTLLKVRDGQFQTNCEYVVLFPNV
jgi:hypothetical protein